MATIAPLGPADPCRLDAALHALPDVPGDFLLYDGACPFCSAFVRHARLREAAGEVRLVDARAAGPLAEAVRRAGYDLDQGMLLRLGSGYFHGAACLNALALLSTRAGAFNRVMAWAFRSRARADALYPLLRGGRAATLRLLGRRPLGDGGP